MCAVTQKDNRTDSRRLCKLRRLQLCIDYSMHTFVCCLWLLEAFEDSRTLAATSPLSALRCSYLLRSCCYPTAKKVFARMKTTKVSCSFAFGITGGKMYQGKYYVNSAVLPDQNLASLQEKISLHASDCPFLSTSLSLSEVSLAVWPLW